VLSCRKQNRNLLSQSKLCKNIIAGIEKTVKFDSETQPQQQHDEEQTKKELIEFVTNLREHFLEEEQIVFPLALKANLLQ
jgi:iron-sulfur cluster repair protein YtfE (RIC family)